MGILDPPGISAAVLVGATVNFETTLYYSAVTSSYPARPSTSVAPIVMWVGPTPPTIGGAGNAVNGDFWRKTP